MHIVITPSLKEFSSSPRLLIHYTSRQLEAIYELMQDNTFANGIISMLLKKGLITITAKEDLLTGALGKLGYTETISFIYIKE